MSVTAYGNIERGDADLNFKKLAEIAEALDVDEMEIVNYGNEIYHLNIHDHGIGVGVNRGTHNIYQVDKELFEKMLKDKDDEIAFLRGVGWEGVKNYEMRYLPIEIKDSIKRLPNSLKGSMSS